MPTPLSAIGNDEFWKTATSDYDSLPWQKKLVIQVREFVQNQDSWLGLTSPPVTDVKVLDYACGPGGISLSLLPYTTKILGLDVNKHQVEEFNRRSLGSNFTPDLVRAEEADIFLPDPKDVPSKFSGEDYNNFDYAFCSAALHHVDNPALGVQRLAERVKKDGGRVVILEFLERELIAPGGFGGNVEAGSEEERLRRNAEYRERSHDNSHLKDFAEDFLAKGGQHGVYHEQHAQTHQHHGHGHQHGHSHGHSHGHDHGSDGDRKHGHGPHGFKIAQMEDYFTKAGLVEVKSVTLEEKIVIMGLGDFEIFMTVGVRKE